MTTVTDKTEQKKKLEEFFRILYIPFFLTMVNSAFFKMAMAAFTGHAKNGENLSG